MGNDQSTFRRDLGAHLRHLRTSAGLSQADVGGCIGHRFAFGQAYVSQIESGGKGNVTLDMLARYVLACGALPSEFLGELEKAGLFDSIRAEVETRRAAKSAPIQEIAGVGSVTVEQRQRAHRNERRKQDRDLLHLLEAQCAPLIQPLLAETRVMRYGTFRWAMREFRSAWKRVARLGAADRISALRQELDRVVEKAVGYGLPRAGMEAVRDRAIELLTTETGPTV